MDRLRELALRVVNSPIIGNEVRRMIWQADRFYGEERTLQQCSPQVAIENALEDLHVASVHPTTVARLKLRRLGMIREERNSMAVYQITDPRLLSRLLMTAKQFPRANPEMYYHVFLYPDTCLSSVGGITVSMQQYLPEIEASRLRTRFVHRLYVGPSFLPTLAVDGFAAAAMKFNHDVFEEDRQVVERIRGEREDDLLHPEEELRIKWYRQALTEGL